MLQPLIRQPPQLLIPNSSSELKSVGAPYNGMPPALGLVVPSLASDRPSPFPGPISVGKGHGKAPPVVPGQSLDSLPVANDHLLPVSAPRLDEDRTHLQKSSPPICTLPHPAIGSTELSTDGLRTKATDLLPQTKVATTFSSTNLQFVVKNILRPNKSGYHIRKSLIPKSKNSRLTPSVSSLRVTPLLCRSNRLVHILVPLHVRAASFPTADVHVSHRFPSAGSVA